MKLKLYNDFSEIHMTVASNSLSITRYQLYGGKKKTSLSELNELIVKKQAKNIKTSGIYKDLVCGWVRPIELADESVSETRNWDLSDCRIAEGFLLRVRIEKRAVPTKLLQLIMRERIMQKESKRENPLSRKEKRALKEDVKTELTEHCLPQLSYIDAYWNEERKTIQLFSTSKRHQEIFEGLFRETFSQSLDMSMVRVLPPVLGAVNIESDHQYLPIEKITVATPVVMT